MTLEQIIDDDPSGPPDRSPRAAGGLDARTVARRPPAAPLRWWIEMAFVFVFYVVYSGIRNTFGSASVSPTHALTNARHVISIEKAVGLFHEQALQQRFLPYEAFIRFWNIFYGTFHFVVTIAVLVTLYRRFPSRYRQWRNTLASTTGLALLGFSLFPLMPPRLLTAGATQYGAHLTDYNFVDTLAKVGGLWSFDSGTMQSISNQYAAMPSLHIAWATWCALALIPVLRNRVLRGLLMIYPWMTLFAIVVTANHYWLDAIGGLVTLFVGYLVGATLTRLGDRIGDRRRSDQPSAGSGGRPRWPRQRSEPTAVPS